MSDSGVGRRVAVERSVEESLTPAEMRASNVELAANPWTIRAQLIRGQGQERRLSACRAGRSLPQQRLKRPAAPQSAE